MIRRSLLRSKSSHQPLSYLQTWVGSNTGGPASKAAADNNDVPRSRTNAVHMVANSTSISMQITGQTFLVPTLRLPRSVTPETLHDSLSAALHSSPAARALSNGNGVPLVVDLAAFVPDGSPHFQGADESDVREILQALRTNGLLPVAVTSSSGTVSGAMERMAAGVGLPSIMAGGRGALGGVEVEDLFRVVADRADGLPPSHVASETLKAEVEPRVVQSEPKVEADEVPDKNFKEVIVEKTVVENSETVYHQGHVRSGQQVTSSSNGSIVVMGNVSSGGEVVADGDIHIYGKLKGRALAGLGGEGRVYATSFDPELVCVGGEFRTIEDENDLDGLKAGDPGMAFISNGSLKIVKVGV